MLAHQALWTGPAHQAALRSGAGGLGGSPFYAEAVRAGPALDSAARCIWVTCCCSLHGPWLPVAKLAAYHLPACNQSVLRLHKHPTAWAPNTAAQNVSLQLCPAADARPSIVAAKGAARIGASTVTVVCGLLMTSWATPPDLKPRPPRPRAPRRQRRRPA